VWPAQLAARSDELMQQYRIRGLAPVVPGHGAGRLPAALGDEQQFRGHHRQVVARLVLVSPAAQIYLGYRLKLTLVETLDEHDVLVEQQGAGQSGHEVRTPVGQVSVHEDQQVTLGHQQGLPQRLTLAGEGVQLIIV
jgi:hypothetical protein